MKLRCTPTFSSCNIAKLLSLPRERGVGTSLQRHQDVDRPPEHLCVGGRLGGFQAQQQAAIESLSIPIYGTMLAKGVLVLSKCSLGILAMRQPMRTQAEFGSATRSRRVAALQQRFGWPKVDDLCGARAAAGDGIHSASAMSPRHGPTRRRTTRDPRVASEVCYNARARSS